MSWLTMAAAALIWAPTGLWLVGLAPSWVLLVHTTAVILVIRLYAVAANISNTESVWLVGLISGVIGSLSSELAWHLLPQSNLASAFRAYGGVGSLLYRLDVLRPGWSFVFVGLSGIAYSGLALTIDHLMAYRHRLVGGG